MCRPAGALAAFCAAAVFANGTARAVSQASTAVLAAAAEVRRTFTIHGKPIPPEIFRDFGDGDLADSGSIWVTVDLEAATGSNLYADDIKQDNGWVTQRKANQSINGAEQTDYKYIGATASGLLVAIASYSGGGSGTFYTLHIMDVAAAKAFDLDGKLYDRINLTSLRRRREHFGKRSSHRYHPQRTGRQRIAHNHINHRGEAIDELFGKKLVDRRAECASGPDRRGKAQDRRSIDDPRGRNRDGRDGGRSMRARAGGKPRRVGRRSDHRHHTRGPGALPFSERHAPSARRIWLRCCEDNHRAARRLSLDGKLKLKAPNRIS
jgi:hypothetical protein